MTRPPRHSSKLRPVIALLLAANFVFGLAIIAILPPFEGWNETAHFSRLQAYEFASGSTRAWPISTYVFNYYRRGPMPYTWIDVDLNHLNDKGGGYLTYHDFFAQPKHIADYEATYVNSSVPDSYAPSPQENWEYQHPPLYYMVTAPLLKLMAGHASLITATFVLRLFSWALAFAGFCIGILATRKYLLRINSTEADAITILGLLYPFLMPEYFWEFARMSNDNICLFLFGVAWALLLWHLREPRGKAWIYLTLVLSLSLYAKMLMLPIALGVFGFLAWHHFHERGKDKREAKNWWHPLAKIAALFALTGLPMLFLSFASTAHGMGVNEFSDALASGNVIDLLEKRLSWHNFLVGMKGIFYTFIWIYGSWSAAIIAMPAIVYKTYYVFIGALALMASRRKCGPAFSLPLWVALPVLAGLVAHVLAVILVAPDESKIRDTPGFYFHILAPAWALVYGAGLKLLMDMKGPRIALSGLIAAVIAFDFFIVWSYMTMFSGCAVPAHSGAVLLLGVPDILRCTDTPGAVIGNLSHVAWPQIGLYSLGLAAALMIAGGCLSLPARRTGR